MRAIETMIVSPEALKAGLIKGAKTYLNTPEDQYKPGIAHGKTGLNRAENLKDIQENDPTKLFAILYAVMCPHRLLTNPFESRSTYLALCIAKALIQGSYSHFTGICSTTSAPDSDNLSSTSLNGKLIDDSKTAPDAVETHHFNLGSSTVYMKDRALRWMLENTREKMSKEEKKFFDDQVSLFKKALVKKPSDEIVMSTLSKKNEAEVVATPTVELHAI